MFCSKRLRSDEFSRPVRRIDVTEGRNNLLFIPQDAAWSSLPGPRELVIGFGVLVVAPSHSASSMVGGGCRLSSRPKVDVSLATAVKKSSRKTPSSIFWRFLRWSDTQSQTLRFMWSEGD